MFVRMGPTPMKLAAVVAFGLVAGMVARIAYEQTVNPSRLAQPKPTSTIAATSVIKKKRKPSSTRTQVTSMVWTRTPLVHFPLLD
jgi:hypothetical protein